MTKATEVREELQRLEEHDYDRIVGGYHETVEAFMRRVVEDGTFNPDAKVKLDVSLTLQERLTGQREQDVTAVFISGLMLGGALERDVPTGTDVEEQWRRRGANLPDGDADE